MICLLQKRVFILLQIHTCSIFIVIAEVKINGSAELQNIAPLVFVDNFVLRLLLERRWTVTRNRLG